TAMLAPEALAPSQTIDRHPLTVSPKTPVSQVVTLMSQARASCVLVTQHKKLVGIFTERDVVRLAAAGIALAGVEIATVMTQGAIALAESEAHDIVRVLSLLRQHRIRHLPIVNYRNELAGIITHASIREMLQPADLLKLRRIAEVMTTEVIYAPMTASVFQLTQLMATHHVSCVVIVDSESEHSLRPVGIVTERDIVQLQAMGVNFNQMQAQEVMSNPLLPSRPTETLWSAHKKMRENSIRRLVVVGDAGELIGIVTQSSLLSVLDPIEMLAALDTLQQLVEERTINLRLVNEQLQSEIIERKRAQAALENQISRERLMGGIATRIHQSLNLEEILHTTVQEVQQFLGCDRVLLYQLCSDGTGSVVTEALNQDQQSILKQIFPIKISPDEYARLYHQGQIRAIKDVDQDHVAPCLSKFLQQFEATAKILVPIIQQEKLWGFMVVNHSCKPREWQPLEIELLEQLATHIAIALKQSELYKQAQIELIERQKAEDKLKELASMLQTANDGLEIQVEKRTTELRDTLEQLQTEMASRLRAEEEVRKSLEKEKELSELKTRFISMASHEFRTPLSTILTSSELIKNFGYQFTEERKIQHLNKIQTAVKEMTNLLEDVLLIGKTSSGRIEFLPAPINLQEVCQDILEDIELTSGQNYRFVFDCQSDCSNIEMDQKLLRQMLTNLLSNAVKYSPHGGTVYLKLVCDERQAIFQVKDEGIGIPKADQARLFEIFHRGSNVGTISGTGLGTAIIKNAVEAHGGTITLESEVGVGTTFTIYVPTSQIHGQIRCASPIEFANAS
ncbi:MAG TPA: CBS domain-containing protein, partial [Candidatus Obscuribacterales bacterium]